jgi:hypothetical protein
MYVGLGFTIISLSYSAMSTGQSGIFSAHEMEGPYNYSFFHFSFVMASFYMASVITKWGIPDKFQSDIIGNIM